MCGIMSGMSEAVCCDDMKVELYGTVFTIRQSPCWLGDYCCRVNDIFSAFLYERLLIFACMLT